jgi:hypothetical protein
MTAVVAMLLVVVLAACGLSATPTPSPEPQSPAPVSVAPSSTPDPEAAAAYAAAICPIFDTILVIDPRLGVLRAAGAEGGDMTAHDAELSALADELRLVLNDLDDVPEWGPGNRFRFELTSSLHTIRAELLALARDTSHPEAAAAMAGIHFLASTAMDRAFASAVEGGFECAGDS